MYSVEDMYDIIEVNLVDSYNRYLAQKFYDEKGS